MQPAEAAVDPLDEEEQEHVIQQFESEIDGQFKLLRRVVVAVCLLWGAVVVLLLALQPVHLCRLVNRGAFSQQRPSFDECPSHIVALIHGVGAALCVPHAFTTASLLQSCSGGGGGGGGHSPTRLTKLRWLSLIAHALPLLVITYSLNVDGSSSAAAIAAAARGGGPAVGDFAEGGMASLDLPLLRGVLAAMVAVSLLLLFLARSVFACRDDLRSDLQRLAAKRYSYKAL